MTKEEFKDIQAQMGLTNAAMAKKLGMSIRNVEDMRAGRRPVQLWTAKLLEYIFKGCKDLRVF